MKIDTTQPIAGVWTAWDKETPEGPRACGESEREAIERLVDELLEHERRGADRDIAKIAAERDGAKNALSEITLERDEERERVRVLTSELACAKGVALDTQRALGGHLDTKVGTVQSIKRLTHDLAELALKRVNERREAKRRITDLEVLITAISDALMAPNADRSDLPGIAHKTLLAMRKAIAQVERLVPYAESLELALDPRRWGRKMNEAWHRNIPDTKAAFAALLEAAKEHARTSPAAMGASLESPEIDHAEPDQVGEFSSALLEPHHAGTQPEAKP